jgi:hypothetical protein
MSISAVVRLAPFIMDSTILSGQIQFRLDFATFNSGHLAPPVVLLLLLLVVVVVGDPFGCCC